MGWGTFVAGQVASSIRRSGRNQSSDDFEFLGVILQGIGWMRGKYQQGYIRRVLKQTVLIHPEIEKVTDWEVWEEDITKRANQDWYVILIFSAVINSVWAVSATWGLFATIPIVWYYGKSRLAKRYSKEINLSFIAKGYDVDKLKAELPTLLQRFKDEEAQAQRDLEAAEEKRKVKEAQERERRKFGK
jgi:hypothetical protein